MTIYVTSIILRAGDEMDMIMRVFSHTMLDDGIIQAKIKLAAVVITVGSVSSNSSRYMHSVDDLFSDTRTRCSLILKLSTE